MKRYFDIHDKQMTAELNIEDGSSATIAPVEEFNDYFKSTDVRELTSSQYRRMTIQYTS